MNSADFESFKEKRKKCSALLLVNYQIALLVKSRIQEKLDELKENV